MDNGARWKKNERKTIFESIPRCLSVYKRKLFEYLRFLFLKIRARSRIFCSTSRAEPEKKFSSRAEPSLHGVRAEPRRADEKIFGPRAEPSRAGMKISRAEPSRALELHTSLDFEARLGSAREIFISARLGSARGPKNFSSARLGSNSCRLGSARLGSKTFFLARLSSYCRKFVSGLDFFKNLKYSKNFLL